MNSPDQSSDNDPCRALWGSWLGGIPGQHGSSSKLFQPATKGVVRYNLLSIERALFPPKAPVLVTATVVAAATLLPEDQHCWRIPGCL